MKFNVREHTTRRGTQCVDIMTDDGVLIGMMYTLGPNIVSVMSKFGVNAVINEDTFGSPPIPEAIITIGEATRVGKQ